MGKGTIAEAEGAFSKAPNWNFNDDKVKFDTDDVDNPNENFGSASGFVPNCLSRTKGTSRCLLCYLSERIHPPSMRPISSTSPSRAIYFF